MDSTAGAAVVPAESGDHRRLACQGWRVAEVSFGAQLDLTPELLARLTVIAQQLRDITIRPLTADDVLSVVALDGCTASDYPGGPATSHAPLTPETAAPGPSHFGVGAFDQAGTLIAMTWLELSLASHAAEVDFTVVDPHRRGRGLATAVKAASIVALADAGVHRIRTGGSIRNAAILRSDVELGFRIDEWWVTLLPPGG